MPGVFPGMTTRSRFRAAATAAAFLLLALALSACGEPAGQPAGDEPAGEEPADGSGAMLPPDQQPSQTALDVTVDDGSGSTVTFRVICDDAPRFEGDAGDRDPKAACDAVAAAKDRLLALSDPDREPEMCTEQYGGPEKATIAGTVDGEQVSAEVARHNGCGISDWDALEPLLGKPTGVVQ